MAFTYQVRKSGLTIGLSLAEIDVVAGYDIRANGRTDSDEKSIASRNYGF